MKRLNPIEMCDWELCNEYNREIMEEFLMNSPQLSDKTKVAYRSNLMIWLRAS